MRDFTRFFQALLAAELRGVQSLTRLARSPLLTQEERDFAGDVVRVDEIRHVTLVQGLIPWLPSASVEPLGALTDEEIIARQPRVEALLVRRGPVLYPEMSAEQIEVMKAIIEDEKGHIRWGLGVRDRLGLRTIRALHRSPAALMAVKSLKEQG